MKNVPRKVLKKLKANQKEFRALFPCFKGVNYFLYIDANKCNFDTYEISDIDALVSFLSDNQAFVVIDDFQYMLKRKKSNLFYFYNGLNEELVKIVLMGSRMVDDIEFKDQNKHTIIIQEQHYTDSVDVILDLIRFD